jgi:hypothetical protein
MVAAGCGGDSAETPSRDGGPIPVAPVLNKHELTANEKALLGPSGKKIPVDQEQVVGYVDAAAPNGKYIDLNGWGARADLSAPADAFVAIAGGKSVAVTPSVDRPDVAEGYDKPALQRSGFGVSVPLSALDCEAPTQGLKTLAVVDGVAAPMKWLGDVGQTIRDACRDSKRSGA